MASTINNLVVTPSIQLGPNDRVTREAFNLGAKPNVSLLITDPIADASYFRNGNFYSSFWATPGGVFCPPGIDTQNATFWKVRSTGTAAITTTGTTASGNTVITAVASTTGVANGMPISGTGIPAGATVVSFVANTSITLSIAATASGSITLTILPAYVTYDRSTIVPDTASLYSAEIVGHTGVTDVYFIQSIGSDLSATLRRICTISGRFFNSTASPIIPILEIQTANTPDNFASLSGILSSNNLPTCPVGIWTTFTLTIDFTSITNAQNGLYFQFHIPSGALNAGTSKVNFSRVKLQTGSVATPFVDDVSLFIAAPVVDNSLLQDNAVSTSKIQDAAVTRSKGAAGVFCPIGTVLPHAGPTIPAGCLDADGTAVSRSTWAALFNALTVQTTGDTISGNATINNIPDTSFIDVGTPLSGPGISFGSVVISKTSTTVVLSVAASATATGVALVFAPHGVGDGSTTFNIPDLGGRVAIGNLASTKTYSATGNTHTSTLIDSVSSTVGLVAGMTISGTGIPSGTRVASFTTTTITLSQATTTTATGVALSGTLRTANRLGGFGGVENLSLQDAELATHNHGITDPGHIHSITDPGHQHGLTIFQRNVGSGSGATAYDAGGGILTNGSATGITIQSHATGITINNDGSGTAHPNMPPYVVLNYVVVAQ